MNRAAEQLHLTPQTISGQLSVLEEQLGEQLFKKVGRNLELTDVGRLVKSYADEIFSLGGELEDAVRTLPVQKQQSFRIGIADVIPKSIAHRLIAPVFELPDPVRIICREGTLKSLLAELAIHQLDIVIADSPIPRDVSVRCYNHALGECGVTFFASQSITAEFEQGFPELLDGVPMLIPGENTEIRAQLLQWLEKQRLHPLIVGEFDDSALMKAFGRAGVGVFIAPSAIAAEVEEQFDVVAIGETNEIKDRFYAISAERKISHPAVSAVTESARVWFDCT